MDSVLCGNLCVAIGVRWNDANYAASNLAQTILTSLNSHNGG
jgi:hypothetical protein